MKTTLRFAQISCRLEVQGLPDLSAGQGGESVGILTGWSLHWVGRPELEGRREHLEALMAAVLPYARHLISGVRRRFGQQDQPVEVGPAAEGGHELLLRSSQPDTPPLRVHLDDAELADLVRVLDQLRTDPRLKLPLAIPACQPLRARELEQRTPRLQRLAAPLGGALALAMLAAVGVLLPVPRPLPLPRPLPEREVPISGSSGAPSSAAGAGTSTGP
jgi:hypothetical protein